MESARVAVLGRGVVPTGTPVVRGDDLGVLHGDGLFESMHLRDGRPWLRDEHLARLSRAAATVGLPLPSTDALVELMETVCAGWPATVEGVLRLVCTRGPEAGGLPTVYATLTEVTAESRHARRTGIIVATLPLPVTAGARAGSDWLPTGIKSTSYAMSTAARRWASGHGVDDVLWVSTDGYVLEGPSASVVWLEESTLCTVPAASTGTLPGVTACWLLRRTPELGLRSAERMITPERLRQACGVWFTSSVRGLAEVRVLDGTPLPPSPHTPILRALLGFPVPPPPHSTPL